MMTENNLEGGLLAKSSRAYKSSKRIRELARLKKQEEKRQRRLAKHQQPQETDAATEQEPGEETPEKETPETD
jgi:hypothetical protein